MDSNPITCSCGAAGNLGEVTEHVISALLDATDTRDHELNVNDPDDIAAARAERERLDGLRHQLTETTGLTATDIAAALKGL